MAEHDEGGQETGESEEQSAGDERPKQRFETFIPDVLRRTFYAGLGAIFTSEEGLRRIANDFSLPKDVATYLITQAQSTKNELFRIFAAEMRHFLDDLRVNEEMQRLLASMSIEVKTEIRFKPNDARLEAVFEKSRVKVKRRRRSRSEKKATGGAQEPLQEPLQEDKDTSAE